MDGGLRVDVFLCASDFPFGKTEIGIIRNGKEKLFFLQKVFLFAIFPRKIANSLFKNAPCGIGSRPLRRAAKGLCPLDSHDFLKKIE